MSAENKIRTAFDSVKADEGLKEATRSFLQEARRKEEKLRRSMRRRTAVLAVCAAMLVLTVGFGGYAMLLVPVSYVSIDVNPSIELELNRIDRVLSAKAYNEDGKRVLEGLSVGGKHYTEAIDLLVESREMQPYLEGDAALTFTVASESRQRENALLDGVRSSSGCMNHGGMSMGTELAMVGEAHGCGLSLGKYAAYKLLQQYDSSLTPEDCHDMTMSEIHGLLREHGHDGNGHGEGWHWGSHGEDGCREDGSGSGAAGTGSGGGAAGIGGTGSGSGASGAEGTGSGGTGHGHGRGHGHGGE